MELSVLQIDFKFFSKVSAPLRLTELLPKNAGTAMCDTFTTAPAVPGRMMKQEVILNAIIDNCDALKKRAFRVIEEAKKYLEI